MPIENFNKHLLAKAIREGWLLLDRANDLIIAEDNKIAIAMRNAYIDSQTLALNCMQMLYNLKFGEKYNANRN